MTEIIYFNILISIDYLLCFHISYLQKIWGAPPPVTILELLKFKDRFLVIISLDIFVGRFRTIYYIFIKKSFIGHVNKIFFPPRQPLFKDSNKKKSLVYNCLGNHGGLCLDVSKSGFTPLFSWFTNQLCLMVNSSEIAWIPFS